MPLVVAFVVGRHGLVSRRAAGVSMVVHSAGGLELGGRGARWLEVVVERLGLHAGELL